MATLTYSLLWLPLRLLPITFPWLPFHSITLPTRLASCSLFNHFTPWFPSTPFEPWGHFNPIHSFDCLYSIYLLHSSDFPPLLFLSLLLWHPVLPSITSLHGLLGTFIFLLTPLTLYIHFNPCIPSAHSSSTSLSTPSTSYASITPSVACILFITSLLGLPFFPLLSPLLRLPSLLLLSRFLWFPVPSLFLHSLYSLYSFYLLYSVYSLYSLYSSSLSPYPMTSLSPCTPFTPLTLLLLWLRLSEREVNEVKRVKEVVGVQEDRGIIGPGDSEEE